MIYETPFVIYTHLCDRHYRLSLPSTAQLFQEVAELHSNSVGAGFRPLLEQGKAWVLTKASYRYLSRYPQLDEEVKLQTWSRGSDTLIATRDCRIVSKMGEILVAITSEWVMMDLTKRRVCRHNEEVKLYSIDEDRALDIDSPKLVMPNDMECVDNYLSPVEYSAIDKAQHVNNAEYLRWFENLLPSEWLESGPLSVDLNYLREMRPDDPSHQINAKIIEGDNREAWFQATTPRGVSVNCHMTFRK